MTQRKWRSEFLTAKCLTKAKLQEITIAIHIQLMKYFLVFFLCLVQMFLNLLYDPLFQFSQGDKQISVCVNPKRKRDEEGNELVGVQQDGEIVVAGTLPAV